MLIGAHVSATGGFENAPENAHKAGCEVFQFFSRSPRGGKAPELTSDVIKEFKDSIKKYEQKECYIHAPYYINLASKKNNIYHGSIAVLREELERGTQLGAKYMMTHLGSAKDLGKKEAIKKVIKGITEILDGYSGSCQLLLEMSAGAGNIIGDTFQEIVKTKILDGVKLHHGANKFPSLESEIIMNVDCYKFLLLENIKYFYKELTDKRGMMHDEAVEKVRYKFNEKKKALSLDYCKEDLKEEVKKIEEYLKELEIKKL